MKQYDIIFFMGSVVILFDQNMLHHSPFFPTSLREPIVRFQRGNISGKANWVLVFSCFYCISRPTRQELLLNIDVLSITDNMASSSTQLPYNPPPANQYDTSLLILQASSKCPKKTSLCCNMKLWLEEAWKVLRLNEVVKGIVNWFIVSGGCGQKTIWQDGLLIDHFPSQIQRE